jgi:uncharacterized membrane protein
LEGLLVLVALAVLAIPVTIVVLAVGQSGLRRRTATLEATLRSLSAEVAVLRKERESAPPAAAFRPAAAAGAERAEIAVEVPVAAEAAVAEAIPDTVPAEAVADTADTPGDAAGPEALSAPSAAAVADSDQDRPLVIRADRVSALGGWLRENWVYAISGLSLAFAGVFLVQWGMERGILPPGLRILAGLAFGAVLVVAGEWLRRRQEARDDDSLAYLPAAFAGAGVVALFAAVVAARQLYDLIGQTTAFAGLAAAGALAVVLGWRHGPLLAALGLIGATLAPFMVGGGGSETGPLHLYFTLIAAVGLAVDAVRRWAWISVLALVLSFAAGFLIHASGTAALPFWIAQLVLLPLLATALPDLTLRPASPGPTVTEAVAGRRNAEDAGRWPAFPVRLAFGSLAAATLGLWLADAPGAETLLVWASLAGLALAFSLWAADARGTADLAALPALGFLLRAATEMQALTFANDQWAQGLYPDAQGEAFWPIVVMAALVSGGFALRAHRDGAGRTGTAYGLAAVAFAPLLLLLVELLWRAKAGWPAPYPWAAAIMVHAAGATFLALAFARSDGEHRRRTAHAGLAALGLIALALFVLTTKAALTLALAVLAAVAAVLDRRFDLREFAVFIQLGLAVLLYRLGVDPGLGWALDASFLQMALAHLGALAGVLAAWQALQADRRPVTRAALAAGAATILALFVSVCLARWLQRGDDPAALGSHWGLTLLALPWLALALSQAALSSRRDGPEPSRGAVQNLRLAVAGLAGLFAVTGLGSAVVSANPLARNWNDAHLVLGPPLLDSLLLAYAVPALILILSARLLSAQLQPLVRRVGAGLLLLWAGLEVRRLMRGPDLTVPGISQPELYAYTVAMTLLGAGLLWQAIARGSPGLRRLAMGVIGLTVAKVFLVDGAQLTGLTRVLSFLGLGLALAGLAWLNRWAARRSAEPPGPPQPSAA